MNLRDKIVVLALLPRRLRVREDEVFPSFFMSQEIRDLRPSEVLLFFPFCGRDLSDG